VLIEGYSEKDAFRWVVSSIEELLKVAEDYGIVLILENH